MDEVERQRATREARAQSVRIPAGFGILDYLGVYLATDAYERQHKDQTPPAQTPHSSEQPR